MGHPLPHRSLEENERKGKVGHPAFVLNVSNLMDSSGVEIAPGHTLRRATRKEIKFIKDTITSRCPILCGERVGGWPRLRRSEFVPQRDKRVPRSSSEASSWFFRFGGRAGF